MKNIKHYILPFLVTIIACVLAFSMFSMLFYQYKKSHEDLIELSSMQSEIVLHSVIIGIQTTTGVKKHLQKEKIDTNVITKLVEDYGTSALIKKLEKPGAIHYIVCHDENQIIAASGDINELTDINSDPFLKESFGKSEKGFRILPGQKYYFESICPFNIDGKKHLLRVCFKISSIQRLESNLIVRLILQASIFIFIIFMLILYFINIHSNRLLAREHDNITSKVKLIQQRMRQQERTSALGRLAAGIAHEIRNPLNGIQMLAQRLEREITPESACVEKFYQFTRVIRDEVKRLNNIVKQFLEFATAKHPSFEQCDIVKLVNDIVFLEQGIAKQQSIDLKTSFSVDFMPAEVDCQMIKQALVNVVQNAMEAMPNGGELTIHLSQIRDKTEIIIEDNGCGMSEEEHEKAFDLYFSTRDDGTGLGLPITKRIIDQHNGEIIIRPRKQGGTLIIIRIPSRRNDEYSGN